MPYDFEVSDVIPATPQEIYNAWLDSDSHSDMTGAPGATVSSKKGGSFSVWGGYITGKNLVLESGKRIVQSWRTTQFTKVHKDSQIEVILDAVKGGTRVTIRHTNVPDDQTSYEKGGWQDNYFDPMKRYFKDKAKKPHR